MKEIKVGEYVRLARNQGINRIEFIEEDDTSGNKYYFLENSIYDEWGEEIHVLIGKQINTEVVKYSPNIIDLIEVGDIVKYDSTSCGCTIAEEVIETCEVEYDADKCKGYICTIKDDCIHLEYIKSIVTKEQFGEMEYKV